MNKNEIQNHIVFQNTPDVLDPAQMSGATGRTAELIMNLLARANHMALTGDTVINSSNVPDDFIQYLSAVTGEYPDIVKTQIEPPLFTKDLLDALPTGSFEGYLLDPYIQSKTIALYSQEQNIPMAYTPSETILNGVTDLANNKKYFRETANQLGIPLIPDQATFTTEDFSGLRKKIIDMMKKHKSVFIQANSSGGGIGNIDIRGNTWQSKLGLGKEKVLEELKKWMKEMKDAGSDTILLAPYVELLSSPTVSGFIPKEGEPIIYGIFDQTLDPTSHDYQGFEWPANDQYSKIYGSTMIKGAKKWFKHLQKLGYVGPSDVDYIIGYNDALGEVIGASESNTRWDAFRFALQHAGRLQRWNLRTLEGIDVLNAPYIKSNDHIHTNAASTTEIVQRLRNGRIPLLGLDHQQMGIIVMVPPQPTDRRGDQQLALAVIGPDKKTTKKLFEDAQILLHS